MNEPAETVETPQNSWINRFQAVFEILLVSGLVSSFIAAFPFYRRLSSAGFPLNDPYLLCAYVLVEAGITLALLFLIMRAHRERIVDLGFRTRVWKPDVLLGVALVPVLFFISGFIAVAFQTYLPRHFSSHNPLLETIHTRQQLELFVFSALIAGGIKEELQRAFILTRFGQHLGGAWVGLLLWSTAFGAAHYVQGWQGVVAAGLFGFIFGALYLARGSLIAPMVAHGLYDSLVLVSYWVFRS
jgi:membrane protease YdiL (CAAX protease family)